jgi:hypothetical protein
MKIKKFTNRGLHYIADYSVADDLGRCIHNSIGNTTARSVNIAICNLVWIAITNSVWRSVRDSTYQRIEQKILITNNNTIKI